MRPAGKDGSMEDFADQMRSTRRLASIPFHAARRSCGGGAPRAPPALALSVLLALKKPTSARFFPLTETLPHGGSDERRHGRDRRGR